MVELTEFFHIAENVALSVLAYRLEALGSCRILVPRRTQGCTTWQTGSWKPSKASGATNPIRTIHYPNAWYFIIRECSSLPEVSSSTRSQLQIA